MFYIIGRIQQLWNLSEYISHIKYHHYISTYILMKSCYVTANVWRLCDELYNKQVIIYNYMMMCYALLTDCVPRERDTGEQVLKH